MVIQVVDADYSQFYLRNDESHFHADSGDLLVDTGLASHDGHGSILFVSFQQNGPLPIDVRVLAAEPDEPGSDWQDVVEVSLVAGPTSTLRGWSHDSDGLPLGLTPGRSYRVRYAVADGDRARDRWVGGEDAPPPERYRIEIWPASRAAPAIVRSESGAGQYWNFQHDADAAKVRVAELSPGERTRAIIDIGLREHPDTARRIAGGEDAFLGGIIAYAQKIQPAELSGEAIERLIRQRAVEMSPAEEKRKKKSGDGGI